MNGERHGEDGDGGGGHDMNGGRHGEDGDGGGGHDVNGGRHGEDGDGGGEEIMKNIANSRDNLDVLNELYEKIKEVSSFC